MKIPHWNINSAKLRENEYVDEVQDLNFDLILNIVIPLSFVKALNQFTILNIYRAFLEILPLESTRRLIRVVKIVFIIGSIQFGNNSIGNNSKLIN